MRKLIYKQKIEPIELPPRYFALFPVRVKEAHPTERRTWLIWLEWYQFDRGFRWLIEKQQYEN